MILRVLLLITFTCCVSGTFVVNVTQSFYQAEENHNITLEWSFTTEEDTSHKHISISCKRSTDHKVLFDLYQGVEYPEYQDDQFAGRVQCDKDVLREGRLRLHVSRLKIEDSGLYWCKVRTSDSVDEARCRLNVTAARDQPEPERPNTASEGDITLYWSVGVPAAVLLVICCLLFIYYLDSKKESLSYPL